MKKLTLCASILTCSLITACGTAPTNKTTNSASKPTLASVKFDSSSISASSVIEKGCELPTPQKLSKVMPEYPEKAIRAGRTGYTILEFQLNAQGKAENAQAIFTDSPGAFDKTSLTTLNAMSFAVEGRPASCEPQKYRLAYQFSINAECAQDSFPKGMPFICVSAYISPAK